MNELKSGMSTKLKRGGESSVAEGKSNRIEGIDRRMEYVSNLMEEGSKRRRRKKIESQRMIGR